MIHAICLARRSLTALDRTPLGSDSIWVTSRYDGIDGGIARCSVCGKCWAFMATPNIESSPAAGLREFGMKLLPAAVCNQLRLALRRVVPLVEHGIDFGFADYGCREFGDGHSEPSDAEWKAAAKLELSIWGDPGSFDRIVIAERQTFEIHAVLLA